MAQSLSAFLAQNTVKVDNQKVEVSKRFKNEDGSIAPFEVRALTSKEDEEIRSECTVKKQVVGKPGRYTMDLDSNRYMGKLAAACTVHPELRSAELQDSYGVFEPDELLKTMLLPGEYADYLKKVQEINGFDVSLDELKEQAKN